MQKPYSMVGGSFIKSQCSKINSKQDKNIREWRKIKHELVIDAIDDINTNTHLTIKLIEIKVGRSVESVQFSIEKKRQTIQLSNTKYLRI